jgi:hypothetical protein
MNPTRPLAVVMSALVALVTACTASPAPATPTPAIVLPDASQMRWTCVRDDTKGTPLDDGPAIPLSTDTPLLLADQLIGAGAFLTVRSGELVSVPTAAVASCRRPPRAIEQQDVATPIRLTGKHVLHGDGPARLPAGTPGRLERVLRLIDADGDAEELLVGVTYEGSDWIRFIGSRSTVSDCGEAGC